MKLIILSANTSDSNFLRVKFSLFFSLSLSLLSICFSFQVSKSHFKRIKNEIRSWRREKETATVSLYKNEPLFTFSFFRLL